MKKLIILIYFSLNLLQLVGQDTIVYWNFNNENLIASIGQNRGLVKNIGHTTTRWNQGASGAINDRSWEISSFPLQSQSFSSGTAGIEVRFNTRGYKDIILCFDQWADSDASRWVQIDFSPDGGVCWHIADWVNEGELSPHGQWYSFAINLTTLLEANDNPDFRIRITSRFSPRSFYETPTISYDRNIAYMRANSNSTYTNQQPPIIDNGRYNPNATWRFDNIIIKGTPFTPLPVSLLSFEVKPIIEMNQISFVTAKEVNSDYFDILKSDNGLQFYKIGALEGSGNSDEMVKYSFEDHEINRPINFYKLKQVDFDGSYEYSNIVKVNNKFVKLSSQIHPTVTNNYIEILNDIPNYHLEIYDMNGNKIKSLKNLSGNSLVDVSELEKGAYLVNIVTLDGEEVIKIIKL